MLFELEWEVDRRDVHRCWSSMVFEGPAPIGARRDRFPREVERWLARVVLGTVGRDEALRSVRVSVYRPAKVTRDGLAWCAVSTRVFELGDPGAWRWARGAMRDV